MHTGNAYCPEPTAVHVCVRARVWATNRHVRALGGGGGRMHLPRARTHVASRRAAAFAFVTIAATFLPFRMIRASVMRRATSWAP